MIEARNDYAAQMQSKLSTTVTNDKYQRALNEIEGSEDKKCYQALGKAYILRKNEDLKKDYQGLIDDNEKELTNIGVIFILNSALNFFFLGEN